MDKKQCTQCKKHKGLHLFNKPENKWCMLCVQKKQLYNENFNKKNKPSYMLTIIKARARKYGIPFNLTREDIDIPDYCPVLGIPLDWSDREHTPSIDKIIPKKGYITGNIAVMSMKANRMKQDSSLEDLEKLVTWLKSETFK